jgi:RNA polymerase sigma-70 factor (ECF subfamily)
MKPKGGETPVVSDQRERTAPDIDLSASASFEDVVEAESGRIFAALRLVAGDRAEAESLMLDAFMDVWDRWDRVRASGDAAGELFRTAISMYQRRLAFESHLRRRKPPPADDPIVQLEAGDEMLVALDALEPKERLSLVLMDLYGYPSREVGELMGIRAADVRAYASHGRAELRRRLENGDG